MTAGSGKSSKRERRAFPTSHAVSAVNEEKINDFSTSAIVLMSRGGGARDDMVDRSHDRIQSSSHLLLLDLRCMRDHGVSFRMPITRGHAI